MEGASIELALDRIEAALARIDNAASRDTTSQDDLAERHQRLREAVAQSLRQLDGLLGGQRS
jgi:hypothetical protein